MILMLNGMNFTRDAGFVYFNKNISYFNREIIYVANFQTLNIINLLHVHTGIRQ